MTPACSDVFGHGAEVKQSLSLRLHFSRTRNVHCFRKVRGQCQDKVGGWGFLVTLKAVSQGKECPAGEMQCRLNKS